METVQFKTNMHCSGCVAKAAPFLDKVAGRGNWFVDTENKDKILTVTARALAGSIENAVKAAGFNATVLQ